MSKRESIARYRIIMNKIKSSPSTFADIRFHLENQSELQGYNYNISKRTFQRDIIDINELFGVEIKYDFSNKVYYVINEEQSEVNDRILEAFDTFNALNIADKFSNKIHFEQRKPQGTENLYGLMHAIKNQLQIKFLYEKYYEDNVSERFVEPYALKEFKNRWYILGKDENDKLTKNFALDRIHGLEFTKKHFELIKPFDVNEYYQYSFGIISPIDEKPENVILSFTEFQGKYIKSLPLHKSQQILVDTKEELRISLKIKITYDFEMELLSMCENVKVIEPKSLVDKIKKSYKKALEQYN